MLSYISIIPDNPHVLLLFLHLSITCTSSSIKSTTCYSRFFFICCTIHNWRNTNITSCRTSSGMRRICTRFLYLSREIFDVLYEDVSYSCHSLSFELFLKVFPVTWTLLFLSFISWIPTIPIYYEYLQGFFWVVQTKYYLNVKSLFGGKTVNWKPLKYFWCICMSYC